jgi:hypothetical protein
MAAARDVKYVRDMQGALSSRRHKSSFPPAKLSYSLGKHHGDDG